MFPLCLVAYSAAAIAYYTEVFNRAPVIEDVSTEPCQIIDLFPQEAEIPKAA